MNTTTSLRMINVSLTTQEVELLCETGYAARFHLTETQRLILITFNVAIVGALNLILNFMVIISLHCTGQLKRPALRLFLYQSIANVGVSITSPTTVVLILTKYAHQLDCMAESLFFFAEGFFIVMSCSMLILIAFDRYACMQYLTKYHLVITKDRINAMTASMMLFALINSTLGCLGTHIGMFGQMVGVSIALTLIIFIPLLGLYFKSQRMVQRHLSFMKTLNVSNKAFMKNFDRSFTRLVRFELGTSGIFYSLFVVSSVANVAFEGNFYKQGSVSTRSWLEFGILAGTYFSLISCITNAVIFIMMNKKAKNFWRTFMKKKLVYLSSFYSGGTSSEPRPNQSQGIANGMMEQKTNTTYIVGVNTPHL